MSDYDKKLADLLNRQDAKIRDLEKKLAEANEKLETINFWHQLRETKEKLALAVEAINHCAFTYERPTIIKQVLRKALKELSEQ